MAETVSQGQKPGCTFLTGIGRSNQVQWIEKPKQWFLGLIEGDTLLESTPFLLICAEFPCSRSLCVSVLLCFLGHVFLLWDGGYVWRQSQLVNGDG